MHLAPTTFTADFHSPTGRAYYQGVLSLGAAYWAVGAVCFLIFAALNIAACCCRSKPTADKQRSGCGNFCRALFNPSGWLILGVVLVAGVCAAAMARMTAFRDTVTSSVSEIDSMRALLSTTGALASGNLATSLGGVNVTLASLYAAAQAAGAAQGDLNTIAGLQVNALTAMGTASTLGSQLSAASTAIFSQLRTGSLDVNALGKEVFAGGIAALALYFVFFLLVSFTLCKSRCCATTFRICNVALSIVFLLTFVFAGIFLTVSVVSSDVCVAPASAISSALNASNLVDPTAADTVNYYSSCMSASGAIAPPTAGAPLQLANGQAQFNAAQASFNTFAASAQSSYPALQPQLDAVNASFTAAGASLGSVVAQASCAPANAIANSLFTTLCNTGIVGIIDVWALATAACLLILIVTISAARICWRHPGDEAPKNRDARADVVAATAIAGGPAPTYIAMGPATGHAQAYATTPQQPQWR